MNATVWPKQPPKLSPEQALAREEFMLKWHEQLPTKYAFLERFNHQSIARLKRPTDIRTLEIGAGLGAHLEFENLHDQTYTCLEMRADFCAVLREKLAAKSQKSPARKVKVVCGDIQQCQPWDSASFDRVVAIHVLEHLRDLPRALSEISRLLVPGGIFDVVIPCEGEFSYSIARKVSAQRFFERTFQMSYAPIVANEHVSTRKEILAELKRNFRIASRQYFPTAVPIAALNLVEAIRFIRI